MGLYYVVVEACRHGGRAGLSGLQRSVLSGDERSDLDNLCDVSDYWGMPGYVQVDVLLCNKPPYTRINVHMHPQADSHPV